MSHLEWKGIRQVSLAAKLEVNYGCGLCEKLPWVITMHQYNSWLHLVVLSNMSDMAAKSLYVLYRPLFDKRKPENTTDNKVNLNLGRKG